MKKVGIFGIGAIGSILSKYLVRNVDSEFYFFNRTNHKSIRVIHDQREDEILLNLANEESGKLDWLIICLKEYQIEEANKSIQKLISEHTKLVIFQNGINISEPYKALVNENQILETIIDCPTERIDRTHFNQIRNPLIVVPKSQIANEFIDLFNDEEIKFEQTQDFIKSQWIKLIESSSIGAIQSLTNKPCSIFQEDKYLTDYKLLIKEGIEVAKSESVDIGSELPNQLLGKLLNYPSSKGSSMLTDKLNGNILELEVKIGAIVNVARRNNIKIPLSERYYESLLNYNIGTIRRR